MRQVIVSLMISLMVGAIWICGAWAGTEKFTSDVRDIFLAVLLYGAVVLGVFVVDSIVGKKKRGK